MAPSQNDLPVVPIAWEFMKSELWTVDQWILDAFNASRESPSLFERVLGVALLTQLAEPKHIAFDEAMVMAMFKKQDPSGLGETWFRHLCEQNPELQYRLEQEWESRATALAESFPEFEEFVAKTQNEDLLWQEGLKILHARDDLQRVAGILAQAMDWRDKMYIRCENLDMQCAIYHSIWALIPARGDKRLSKSIIANLSDFYDIDWWTIPVQLYHADKHQQLADSGLLEKAPQLELEALGHYWLGLFKPDGTLRDNFLMYVGGDSDLCQPPINALQALGEIKPEHLFHGGCQILADTEMGLANFASVTPFNAGDTFALVGSDEHKRLVGELEHLTVMNAIMACQESAETRRKERKCMNAEIEIRERECEAEMMRLINITPPALDMFLDIATAPDWLKQFTTESFQHGSLNSICNAIGFLARTGMDEHQANAVAWAKSLNRGQLDFILDCLQRKIPDLSENCIVGKQAAAKQPDEFAQIGLVILVDRDDCENLAWILKTVISELPFTFEIVDVFLQLESWLFEQTYTHDVMRLERLRLVRERCPACWWASSANIG